MLQNPLSVVLSLVVGLVLFVLVLFLAWLCTRWLGGYYRARGAQGGSIRVLERTVIGPDRTLMVVRVGELSPDAYPEEGGPEPLLGTTDFSAALQDAVKRWIPGKKQEEHGNKDE